MSMTEKLPKQINWKIWAGSSLAAIVLVVALGYTFDWFGSDASVTSAPVVEETE